MVAIAGRYPLSTVTGDAIPLDILKPLAVIPVNYNAGAFSAFSLNAAYTDKPLNCYSTTDCWLTWAGAPILPSNGVANVSTLFIPAGILISFIANATSFNVSGDALAGKLILQVVEAWSGLALEIQTNRV